MAPGTDGWIIGNDSDVDLFATVDDHLARAATAAAASARRRDPVEQGLVLAEWERRQRRRPSLLLRAVDSLPYLGPLLVAMATSIWLYDLLLLVRLLVLDR